jgi:hypothetical protein
MKHLDLNGNESTSIQPVDVETGTREENVALDVSIDELTRVKGGSGRKSNDQMVRISESEKEIQQSHMISDLELT